MARFSEVRVMMRRSVYFGFCVVAACLLAGCSDSGKSANGEPAVPTAKKTEKPANAAPDQFFVKFETTKGDFVVEVNRDWAPHGADRFHELVQQKFFDGCGFFRVVRGFMVQFGINGDPEVNLKWLNEKIPDDPVVESNKRGTITFAMGGPNTRTTQMFINFTDTGGGRYQLDQQGFAPFGKVISGMEEVVEKLYNGYGELPDFGGRAPDPRQIMANGTRFLKQAFPKLDYINKATIIPAAEATKLKSDKKPAETSADKAATPAEKKDAAK